MWLRDLIEKSRIDGFCIKFYQPDKYLKQKSALAIRKLKLLPALLHSSVLSLCIVVLPENLPLLHLISLHWATTHQMMLFCVRYVPTEKKSRSQGSKSLIIKSFDILITTTVWEKEDEINWTTKSTYKMLKWLFEIPSAMLKNLDKPKNAYKFSDRIIINLKRDKKLTKKYSSSNTTQIIYI